MQQKSADHERMVISYQYLGSQIRSARHAHGLVQVDFDWVQLFVDEHGHGSSHSFHFDPRLLVYGRRHERVADDMPVWPFGVVPFRQDRLALFCCRVDEDVAVLRYLCSDCPAVHLDMDSVSRKTLCEARWKRADLDLCLQLVQEIRRQFTL